MKKCKNPIPSISENLRRWCLINLPKYNITFADEIRLLGDAKKYLNCIN